MWACRQVNSLANMFRVIRGASVELRFVPRTGLARVERADEEAVQGGREPHMHTVSDPVLEVFAACETQRAGQFQNGGFREILALGRKERRGQDNDFNGLCRRRNPTAGGVAFLFPI